MKVAHDMIAIMIAIEVVQVVIPNAREQTVRRANNPMGRRLSCAKRTTIAPQKKYPMPHASEGIHKRFPISFCETPRPLFKYTESSVRIGPGAIDGKP